MMNISESETPPIGLIALEKRRFARDADGSLVKWVRRVSSSLRSLVSFGVEQHQPAVALGRGEMIDEWERLQGALDSISAAIAITDFGGHIVYLNKSAERLTGFQVQLALNNPINEVFSVFDAASGVALDNLAAESIVENSERIALKDSMLKRRDGTLVAVEVSSTPIQDRRGGVMGAVIVARDMTSLTEASKRLSHMALHDHLTNLPNRTLFADRLEYAVSRSNRTKRSFSVLYIDLDDFKRVNDSFGHEAGDQLLQIAAARLQQCIRQSDTVSRHGGDEFVVLLDECPEVDAGQCASQMVTALSKPYSVGGRRICLSASIGIAAFPADASEGKELIRAADVAMYRVKSAGGNGFQLIDRKSSVAGTAVAEHLLVHP